MANSSSMPGRSTLTATSRPSVVTARWTWAIEAAPTGTSSNSRTGFRAARRTSVSMVRLISANGAGGRSSWSCDRFRRRFLADQVGPGRQRLAELDRRRADRDAAPSAYSRRRAGCAPRSARSGPAGAPAAGSCGSCSIPRSAPCRASVRPHFSKRHRWVTDRRSNLPARLDGHQPAEHRLGRGANEAGSAIIRLNASGRGKRRMLSTR